MLHTQLPFPALDAGICMQPPLIDIFTQPASRSKQQVLHSQHANPTAPPWFFQGAIPMTPKMPNTPGSSDGNKQSAAAAQQGGAEGLAAGGQGGGGDPQAQAQAHEGGGCQGVPAHQRACRPAHSPQPAS